MLRNLKEKLWEEGKAGKAEGTRRLLEHGEMSFTFSANISDLAELRSTRLVGIQQSRIPAK